MLNALKSSLPSTSVYAASEVLKSLEILVGFESTTFKVFISCPFDFIFLSYLQKNEGFFSFPQLLAELSLIKHLDFSFLDSKVKYGHESNCYARLLIKCGTRK